MQFLMLWGWPFYFQTLVTELVIHLETKPFGDVSYKAQLKIVLRKGKKKKYEVTFSFPKAVEVLCDCTIRKCVHYLYICSVNKQILTSFMHKNCLFYVWNS